MTAHGVEAVLRHGAGAKQFSRRKFLEAMGGAGAGLVVMWSTAAARSAPTTTGSSESAALSASGPHVGSGATALAQAAQRTIPMNVDAYLRVNPDGSISLATGKIEYGQGNKTAFAQLVAEELSVPFAWVSVIMGNTSTTPFDLGTFGSLSMRETGPVIRQAAATMREWLIQLASDELKMPASQLMAQNGAIVVTKNPKQQVTYAALAGGHKSARMIDKKVALKDPMTYTVVGQSIPRVDIPAKVNGAMKYGYGVQTPGMVWGKIVRPPSVGATLTSIDFSAAQKMPGVVGVFRDGDFAGIAAEWIEQAENAIGAVKATWHEQKMGINTDNIFDVIERTAKPVAVEKETTGDPVPALAKAAKRLTTNFQAAYVSHQPMEPMNALVDARPAPEKVMVWTSTQDPWSNQADVAATLNRSLDDVEVITLMSGGGFGMKNLTTAAVEAARLSQAFGKPVKVNWTREEMFRFDEYRPAAVGIIQTGLDSDGNVVGWQYDLKSAIYGTPGSQDAETGLASDNDNILDMYPGLPNARTTQYQASGPLPVSPWRGNGASFNIFAMESTIDELAEMAGQDPVAFRTKLLQNNPRMLSVMRAAVEEADWTPGVGPTGQGIGIALDYDRNTYVAEVAHVTVDKSTGKVKVNHVDVAVDCGLAVNPAGVKYQMEGGVVLSTSATMNERITFNDGAVTVTQLADYHPITIEEAPSVNVVVMKPPTQEMHGIGEPGVPPLPAAVANAIYDAIGVRVRQMPFTPDTVLAAIKNS